MVYRKLKRVSSQGYSNYIPNFTKVFPELKNLSNDELAYRFDELNLKFYTENKKPVSFGVRITLPFAIIVMLLMIIGLPINFLITGKWFYGFNDENYIHNWFRSLNLQ